MTQRQSRRRMVEQSFWVACEPCVSAHEDRNYSTLTSLGVKKIGFLFIVFLVDYFISKPSPLATILELNDCLCLSNDGRCDEKLADAFVETFFLRDDDRFLKVFHSVGSEANPTWDELSAKTQGELELLYHSLGLCFCRIVLRHDRIAGRVRDAVAEYRER